MKGKAKRFRVGDVVRFPFGSGVGRGTVIEDRGDLARDGGQLLRIRLLTEYPEDEQEIELAAEYMLAPGERSPRPVRRPLRPATSH